MAMVEDFTVFFNTDEFAVDAVLDGVAVRGIFDQTPANALESASGNAPTFTLPEASHDADPRGQVLAITGGASFTVQDWEPDGTGVSKLILEAV